MRSRAIIAGVLATTLTVAACSGGDPGGGAAEAQAAEGYSVLGALAEVPAPVADEGAVIVTGDLATATEAARLTRPDGLDDHEAVRDWISPLVGYPVDGRSLRTVFVPLGPILMRPVQVLALDAFEEQFGWSLIDVDTFVETFQGGDPYVVVTGDIDPEAEHAAGDTLTVELTDGKAVLAAEPGHASAWLEGEGDTLADDEPLATLAKVLDERDVLGALLLPSTDRGAADASSQTWTRAGIGWGQDAILISFLYPGEEAAHEALPRLEQLFLDDDVRAGAAARQLLRLREADVDGSVVVLTVRPTAAATAAAPYELFMRAEAPFVHN